MQDTEYHETHTDEVSKNVDAEKRELRFVFRTINFPSVESKGEIVCESFVSVKRLQLGKTAVGVSVVPTQLETFNNQCLKAFTVMKTEEMNRRVRFTPMNTQEARKEYSLMKLCMYILSLKTSWTIPES